MKKITLTSILSIMLFCLSAQNVVYTSGGKKESFTSEDLDIIFTNSQVRFPPKIDKGGLEAAGLLALLPTAVDFAFKTTTKILENRVKKFTAEYTKQKSNLDAGSKLVPDFEFKRLITIGGTQKDALKINFKAAPVNQIKGFVYYVDFINLTYSSAKATSKHHALDYTIELKVTFLVDGEKKTQELSPITISSVEFANPGSFTALKYRTDLIPTPDGAVFTEVSVKIVETNPFKVRAEKILATWNDNKDDVKTVINNFLPESKKDDGDKEPAETEPEGKNRDAGSGNN